MEFFDELKSLDVNVDEGLERVMGDGDLYAMMLDMFVTAIDTTPIRPEEFDGAALDAGMDAHVSKPIVLDQLKRTIREVLARKEQEQNKNK